MSDTVVKDEAIEGTSYLECPFVIGRPKDSVIIGDLDKVVKLKHAGLIVLKHVGRNLNRFDSSCTLVVQDICMKEYDVYNETLATRIRRGIRNLLAEKVIAKTLSKNVYWVNKAVIWR